MFLYGWIYNIFWYLIFFKFFHSYISCFLFLLFISLFLSVSLFMSLYTGISTLEAQIWGFYKHVLAQPKEGVAYEIKSVQKGKGVTELPIRADLCLSQSKSMVCTQENHLPGQYGDWKGVSEQSATQISYRASIFFRWRKEEVKNANYKLASSSLAHISVKPSSIFKKYERFLKLLKLSFRCNVSQVSILIY